MNVSYYNSQEDKEILNLYLQILSEVNVSHELMRIETSYGDTNVLIIGDKKLHPLVFLNDPNLRNSISWDLVIELLSDFRIYAVDLFIRTDLGEEPGLSLNDDSYGKWMYEIMSRLGVRNVFLAGISMGGVVAFRTLAFDETKVSKAFLINPEGIVSESASDIPLIPEEEVEKIKTPILIFTNENKELYLCKNFPSLNEMVLIEGSTHELSEHSIKKITEIIRNNIGL